MKIYTRYLQLLQDFQLKLINPLQKIRPYDNYRFGDVEDLNSLRKFIITEFKVAGPGKARLKLKKLKELNIGFTNFDRNYPILYEKSKDGLLKINDLNKLFPLGGLNSALPENRLTPEFVETLYRSILFRQKSLLVLINETEDLLAGITEKKFTLHN